MKFVDLYFHGIHIWYSISKQIRVKPYTFDVCESAFTGKLRLVLYLQIPTGKKLCSCEVYWSTYSWKSYLECCVQIIQARNYIFLCLLICFYRHVKFNVLYVNTHFTTNIFVLLWIWIFTVFTFGEVYANILVRNFVDVHCYEIEIW